MIDKNGRRKEIKTSKQERLLGINLREDLSWEGHLNTGDKALFPATRKLVGALRHLQGITSMKTRLLLANSLVMSRLYYLLPVWGGAPLKHIRELQKLMNITARYVTKLGKKTKTMKLMNKCNWLMADEMIEKQSLIVMWKLIYMERPRHLLDKIEIDNDKLIATQRARLKTVQYGWRWRSTKQWNNLPDSIRKCSNLTKFKNSTEDTHQE